MTINLYNYADDNKLVHKDLTGLTTQSLNGTLRDEGDFIDPVFTTVTDPTGMNYCYIPAFERYYFIRDIVVVRTGLWEVSCHVDVLKTYEDSIHQLMIYADGSNERPSEDDMAGFNKLIPNPYDKFIQPTREKHIEVGAAEGFSGFSYGNFNEYILVTVG